MSRIKQGLSDLMELLFPGLCLSCNERLVSQEIFICHNCWLDLPLTNFQDNPENKVAQLFWGRVQLEHATAFFSYKKGSNYQNLIHYTKYKGRKKLGYETGKRFGFTLANSPAFSSVDCVVPVPLHPKKQKQRGYNQSDFIARGIAESLDKPISVDNLYRRVFTSTQTRKNRFERWQNVDGIFGVRKPNDFANKHVLVVDDVVTTGSTLEACAYELLKIEDTRVSIATLAYADM